MTVAELIERLGEFDPNLEVVASVLYGGYRDVTDADLKEILMNVRTWSDHEGQHDDVRQSEYYPDAVKQTCVNLTL